MSEPRVKLPSATSLVARSAVSHVIGRNNHLPWHLRTDMARFRKRTEGHVVIMGRRTFESIGRPLPNRVNVVLSRSEVDVPGVVWAPNIETALYVADVNTIMLQKKDFFVIGGEQIYSMFSPYINKVFLTEVHDGGLDGDAKFDADFRHEEWDLFRRDEFKSSEKDDFDFSMLCYQRKRWVQRTDFRDRFLRSAPGLSQHIKPYLDLSLRGGLSDQLEMKVG